MSVLKIISVDLSNSKSANADLHNAFSYDVFRCHWNCMNSPEVHPRMARENSSVMYKVLKT